MSCVSVERQGMVAPPSVVSTPSLVSAARGADRRWAHPRRYEWVTLAPFVLMHVGALVALYTGVSKATLLCCIVLYAVRMFGVTAGYHRYFAHRTFKTSRIGQFILAWLAESACQKGVLTWA